MSGLTDRLRQVAGQATPGPWQIDGPWWHDMDDPVPVVTALATRSAVAVPMPFEHLRDDDRRPEDMEHVATFDPVLVTAMLDVIDAAEQVDAWVGTDGEWDAYLTLHKRLHRFREVAG